MPSKPLDELEKAGRIYWPKKEGGMPRLKRYLDEQEGVQVDTIWSERTFIALQSSWQFNLENPYPRSSAQGWTEQSKLKLNTPSDARERGEDLLVRYSKTLPASLAGTLPSLAATYDSLSKRMHARSGSADEFNAQLQAVCDHIEGAALLGKYAKPNS